MDDMNKEINRSDNSEKKPVHKKGPSYWVSVILALLLFGSIIFNVVLMILLGTCAGLTGGFPEKDHLNYSETSVMGDEKSKNKILELSLIGVIMDNEDNYRSKDSIVSRMRTELQMARKDESIKGVLLVINSPGGGITASDVLWKEVSRFKTDRKIPVVTYCKDLTASGGYYVASATDYIMAHETSLVGNIGVIAEFVCVKELFNKIGVDVNIIKSNTFDGRESVKDMGSPFRTMKPKEKKIFQDMINEMWNRFVDVVAEGRKKVLTRDQVAKLADGSIYTGKGAKEKKLVDECGFKEDAFNKVKQMANLTDAKLVRYKYRYSPLSELLGAKFRGENTIQIGPDFKELIHDRSPRLMYLWTTD